ncbi:putative hydro-lyase [Labrenzia sp. 011]|uniref:putative hydro-lyase n=1 Tax=Labrenzia sp. 011 TaxID=2171494 RepID=UPI000D51D6B2|nr:putative hydro-lyase [Labrenzia sp. 011]PVB59335.1 putative hydro-lyase [Labrenzia sp. 011]
MTTALAEFSQLADMAPSDARRAIRLGRYSGHTAGLARGRLQCNLAIVPGDYAADFQAFCRNNPKPCPLAGISAPGDPAIARLGDDVDIRTDAARYNVYRFGKLEEQVTDLSALWQDDLVAFAIGCSFTFENALLRAGFAMRHIDANVTVPMYRTTLETVPAGPFGGGMVVSMRPVAEDRLEEVRAICRTFPLAHGAPVHAGDPRAIGITDLNAPDWGEPVEIRKGEVPVFWACGVTPQVAIMAAKLPLSITHAPGAMLIADVDERTAPIYPYVDN